MTKLAFIGDIMPGGVHNKTDNKFISEELLCVLKGHDLRIGTLECAIGDNFEFDPEKMRRKQDIVYAENRDLERLATLGVNVVSLANNHSYDLGHDGLLNTLKQLDNLNILHCGAGANLEEASKPAVVEINGKKYAFLAFCDNKNYSVGYVPFAAKDKSGINPLFPEEYAISLVKKYKAIYDYVYILPHWGVEHSWFPRYYVISLTRKLIDAGADGVMGSHPHRLQPVYKYKGRYSCFSLGNFLFFDRYINRPRPTYYPPKGCDTSNYPITDQYPYVAEPTLKIWKYLGRIGMILSISQIDNGEEKIEKTITFLSKKNELIKLSQNIEVKINNKLSYIQCIITYLLPLYRITFATKSLLGKIKRTIMK